MVELGHKKAGLEKTKPAFLLNRGDKIRTCGLCVPNIEGDFLSFTIISQISLSTALLFESISNITQDKAE